MLFHTYTKLTFGLSDILVINVVPMHLPLFYAVEEGNLA